MWRYCYCRFTHFTYGFPLLGSGGKVVVGITTLGSFLAIDMALERQRRIIELSKQHNYRIFRTHRFYSLTKKFALISIFVMSFVSVVILLVIGKDIYWISMVEFSDIADAQRTLSIEVAFVVTITTCLILNLIFSYSKNLKLFFENETQVLNEVNQGNLEGYVPVLSHDEFALIADHTNQMIDGLREKRKIQNIFGKVMSPEIANHLMSLDEEELKPGGKKQDLVILMSDVRNFTTLTETMDPQELVKMLNSYFTDMITIIRKEGGIVDKFIGDGILSVFGINNPERAAGHAVGAALSMLDIVRSSEKRYNQHIRIGVGIHSGEVIAGNIGSPERLEYTFIGDTVNTASRLENMTKTFKVPIIISDSVYQDLNDSLINLNWIDFGEQNLRGKTQTIHLLGLNNDLISKEINKI